MSTQADLLAAAEELVDAMSRPIMPSNEVEVGEEVSGARHKLAAIAARARTEAEAQETASDGTALYKQLAAEPVSANETNDIMGVMYKLPELGVGAIISDPVSLVRIGNLSNGVAVALGRAQAGPAKRTLHLPGDNDFNQPPSMRRN